MAPIEILQLINDIHMKHYPELNALSETLTPPLKKREIISLSYMYSELMHQTNSKEKKQIYKLLTECYWTLLLSHNLDITQDYDLHQKYLKGCKRILKLSKTLNLGD